MTQKKLKKKYSDLIKISSLVTGRKETLSYLHKAERVRSKLYSFSRTKCCKCNGFGYKRVSLDEAKTCLDCFGKGYLIQK